MVRRLRGMLRASMLACGVVLAVLETGSGAAADFELGRYLSSECVTCHRGASAQGAIPNIYGLAEPTFAEVLKAYREKKLSNEVMQNVAGRLSDEDIAALATYFARVKTPH